MGLLENQRIDDVCVLHEDNILQNRMQLEA